MPTTSKPKQEPTNSEQKQDPTTSESESVSTTSDSKLEPTTSEQKPLPTTSRAKISDYSIDTIPINNSKTEEILTTAFNHINFTSVATKEIKSPTTIVENIIKTTITTVPESSSVILLGLSHFMKFISYFTFNIHFISIKGFIFSSSLTMSVQLISDRMLRVLQTHKANCTKENDDLEKVAYLCTVLADTSTVNRIKIDSDFNFDSQDITIAGISPIASGLMENVQNALEEYDSLFESDIYILEHSIITANERNKNFNITGIINDPKPTFNNTDLELKINIDKESVTEANINCTIYNINGTNYTLNCLGEKNILYNLHKAQFHS